MKQTFDIAPPAGEQVIPQERQRAQTVEQRADIPMPPIMGSTLVLASEEPSEDSEELRPQCRGLRELLNVTMKLRCCWPDNSPQKKTEILAETAGQCPLRRIDRSLDRRSTRSKNAEKPKLHVHKVATMPVVLQQQAPHPANRSL